MEISCRQVNEKMKAGESLLLLDCRERDEHAFVELPQATLIPMSELRQRIGELSLSRDCDIVVFCHHGSRSLQVAMWMRRFGFARALSMAGGIDEWAREIDPTLPRY